MWNQEPLEEARGFSDQRRDPEPEARAVRAKKKKTTPFENLQQRHVKEEEGDEMPLFNARGPGKSKNEQSRVDFLDDLEDMMGGRK